MAEAGSGNIKVVVRCRCVLSTFSAPSLVSETEMQTAQLARCFIGFLLPESSSNCCCSTEIARGAKGLIRMQGNQTILDPPDPSQVSSSRAIEKAPKLFTFDKSYWSACLKDEPGYASQQTLYDDLGSELLDHSFQGFNCCIFAYGQTGSGKSYSMVCDLL
jgi:hypothetical protein